ncbi:hypothetical protein NDU88_000394 [Pleurodeles waltl]|uniref:Ig-like domain-containing protein n=1 Tax=Pleurodeles waltl TaxID=8319 RepID=A0AAV7P423_PLEWA|nr:hypothetical protein NDU88_000394 [Pleurodeles waltl]
MAALLVLLVLLSTLLPPLSGASSLYVDQQPFLVGAAGMKTALGCQLKDSSKPQMYWYRKTPEKAMEALFSVYRAGDILNFTAEPMTAKRTGDTFEMQFQRLQVSYSAVYYCACSVAQWMRSPQLQTRTHRHSTLLEQLPNTCLVHSNQYCRVSTGWYCQ